MNTAPPRRRGRPATFVVVDLVRHALHTRSWMPLVIVVLAILAVAAAVAGQAALPYAIYPAL